MSDNAINLQFQQLYELIQSARNRALFAVNREHLQLYWQVGAFIHGRLTEENWGEKVVEQFSEWLNEKDPTIKNFDRRNIYRMREFFLAYHNVQLGLDENSLSIVGSTKPQLQPADNNQDTFVVSVKPQIPEMPKWLEKIPWTHHIHILSACKETEERIFYILLTEHEKYTVKELRRQLKSSLYERQKLSSKLLVHLNHPKSEKIPQVFRDRYVFEFLNLPDTFSENDLQKALVGKLKNFLLELGRDFTFLGEEYRLTVGMKDFHTDLLFFHRELQCLVAFELKTTEFEPEYLGQLNFYLEALDRNVKKTHENPSIGVLLCKTKNQEIVEYALSRNITPALIAEYQTHLIDKGVLRKLLHEWSENIENNTDES